MSESGLQQLLYARLKAMAPELATAWPNAPFKQPNNTPWQRVTLLPAENRRGTLGSSGMGSVLKSGILRVTLFYPPNDGVRDATLRAEAIQAQFPRGLKLSQSGTVVRIAEQPTIRPALPEAAWYGLPVDIPYFLYDAA